MVSTGGFVGFFVCLLVCFSWQTHTCDKTMGWIRDRQLMRCPQLFLRWIFLHKAVTDICPWQSPLPRGSCHLPLCAAPLLLMAAAASGTCWKSLQGGDSLLGALVQRRCWGLQAAFIYSFEVANIPVMVLRELLISASPLVTRVGRCGWQGTRTKKVLLAEASGGVRGSWALALLPAPQSSCLRLSFCGQLLKSWYVSCFLDFQINSRSHVVIQSQF